MVHQHTKKLHLKPEMSIGTSAKFWTDRLLKRNRLFLACLEADNNCYGSGGGGGGGDYYYY